MSNTVPFTGSVLYDSPIAILFFFFGVWIIVQKGNKFGWFVLLISAVWGYKLYMAG